ncbi:NSUN5-like protein, partial [Mya arenaria]
NKKSLYAIVCEVIKHRQQLENVGRKCENFGKDKRLAGQPHPFLLHGPPHPQSASVPSKNRPTFTPALQDWGHYTSGQATCVTPVFKDFLSVDPTDSSYARVEYILVDPSCSGSGMVNRVSMKSDEDSYPKERLNQLSKFQISILKHALSFPNVKKIVYSTCSIHEEENEQVVEEVYSHVSEIFEIDHVMPDWPMRGLVTYEHGEKCVRMSHDLTLTNGFFVSSFSRKINKKRKHEEDGCHSEKNRPLKVKVKNTRSSKVVHKSNVRKQQGPSIETHKHLRATTDWKIDIIAV